MIDYIAWSEEYLAEVKSLAEFIHKLEKDIAECNNTYDKQVLIDKRIYYVNRLHELKLTTKHLNERGNKGD